MTLPCGTLSLADACVTVANNAIGCRVVVASNSIGLQIAPQLVGATVRDRTLLDAGETFFAYILDDAGQFIVDDLGQYIISG